MIVGENTLPGQVEGCQMRFVGGKFGGNPGGNVFSGELIVHAHHRLQGTSLQKYKTIESKAN